MKPEGDARGSEWWVYLLRCADGTFYCGVTVDLAQRIEAHNEGRGARYTRGRGPVKLLESAGPFSRGEALKVEHRCKRQSKAAKRAWLRAQSPD